MNITKDTEIPSSAAEIWQVIQVGLWSCLTILVVTGNVVVLMCITLGAKRLGSSMYVFYASLATSDCLVGMFCTPLLMVSTIYQDWVLGEGLCHAYSAILSTSLNASIATLCLISMDRLNAVKHPFDHRSGDTFTQRWKKRMLALVWIHSIFWGSAPLVGWGEIVRDSATFSCKPNWSAKAISDKSYSLFLALFAFGLPVGILIIVYFMIYHYTKKCSQWMKDHEGQKDTMRESIRLLREKAIFKTVLVILGAFGACWAVYTLTTLCKLFIRSDPPDWFIQLGLLFALSGSCVNPVIYAVRDKRLVREFFNLPLMRTCLCMRSDSTPGVTREQYLYTLQSQRLSVTTANFINKSPLGSRELLYKNPEIDVASMRNSQVIKKKIEDEKTQLTVRDDVKTPLNVRDDLKTPLNVRDDVKTPLNVRDDLTQEMIQRMEETNL